MDSQPSREVVQDTSMPGVRVGFGVDRERRTSL